MVGLATVWYAEDDREGFHFFNDNAQWKQVDKAGHFFTAFHISRTGVDLLKGTGLSKQKSIWYGSLAGLIFQTPIELLDGFQSDYGASWGDMAANTAGSSLLLGQHLLWDEVRIQPKFSFSQSGLASRRPNVLGDGYNEQVLKDYNGQTHWLSFDLYAMTGKQEKFPKWLNLAAGYGAADMVFARDGQNRAIGLSPYRQYYLALDIDLMHIRSRSRLLNSVLYVVNIIHLPLPALEWNRKEGVDFHYFKF